MHPYRCQKRRDKNSQLGVKDDKGIYRAIYLLVVKGKVLIPHAFVKKTQRTPKAEINTAQKRLRRLLDENQ